MVSLRFWKIMTAITAITLVFIWMYDIITGRPYHIGPLQMRFIIISAGGFIMTMIFLARESLRELKERDAVRILLETMNSDRGFHGDKPTVEGILMSFYLVHRNPEDWSIDTRTGMKYLSYLKIYIKDRTGEDVSIKELHEALKLIDIRVRKKERELELRKRFDTGQKEIESIF